MMHEALPYYLYWVLCTAVINMYVVGSGFYLDNNPVICMTILYSQSLKGGGHGYFNVAFSVPMFSLGDAETQNSIFKIFRMH